MNKVLVFLAAFSFAVLAPVLGYSCTNYLVTKGASADGSTMITYAADSHVLYGELYHWPAGKWAPGTMMDVVEWDTGKFLGRIPQASETYNVVGNMNEYQVSIGETTYGGREELGQQEGALVDYGSLIYLALQRSKSAREAIKVMTELVAQYGYYSSGESFSIADPDEVWILEMIGKGNGEKGAVWVALMIPDGYVSGHANQARITTFPLDNNKSSLSSKNIKNIFNKGITCVYAEDVITFARKKGYISKDLKDSEFSFSDTYAPVDFGAARFSEIRVWSMFNKVNDQMRNYWEYVKGDIHHDAKTGYANNRMPLWVLPNHKITVTEMMDFMRDHLEGTELDMSKDLGAGPFGNPYRWRPLTFNVDGETYLNERATATQQTGFSFVAQMRSWLPREIGGIFWFSVDDAASTVYFPVYSSSTKVPSLFATGYGSMMNFVDDAGFWVFNQVTNFAYTRYNVIHPEIREKQVALEKEYVSQVAVQDAKALELIKTSPANAVDYLTNYSCTTGNELVMNWKKFYGYLFARYMDGNIKSTVEGQRNPKVEQPGYGEKWNHRMIQDNGENLKYRGKAH